MEQRVLGKTGLKISIYTFGGIIVKELPQNEANNIVAEAVDSGINYFDVAPSYGNSQEILGPALKPYRSKVFLACKSNRRTKAESWAELEKSLVSLKTDYFDVYQLHEVKPDEVDTVLGPGGALETLIEARQKGLVKYIGITSHFDEAALKLINAFDFDTLLFPINWACWLKNGLGQTALKEATKKNMGQIAIKALAERAKEAAGDGYPRCWYRPICDDPELADKALRFTLSQGVHTAVSPGDIRMHKLGLSIIGKYPGKIPPLNAKELEDLQKRAKLIEHTVFPH